MIRKKNLTLGAGKLFFDLFDEDGLPAGEFYLGNTTSVTYEYEETRRGRWTSDEGGCHKTDNAIIGGEGNVRFNVDDLSYEVMAILLRGEAEMLVQTATVGQPIYQEFSAKRAGLWYQLGQDAANPSGLRDVLIEAFYLNGSTNAMSLAQSGNHFVWDEKLARVFLKETSGIALPGIFTVRYRRRASVRPVIEAGTKVFRGSLRYVADNRVGPNVSHYWPLVEIVMRDSFSFKDEGWANITFGGDVLKAPDAPYHVVDFPPVPIQVLEFEMARDPMPAIDDSWNYLHGNLYVSFILAGKGTVGFEAATTVRENIDDTGYDEWVQRPWFRYRYDSETARLRVEVWGQIVEDIRFYTLGDRVENGWQPGDNLIPDAWLDGVPLDVAYTVTAEPDTGAAVAYPENAPFPVVDYDIHFEVPGVL